MIAIESLTNKLFPTQKSSNDHEIYQKGTTQNLDGYDHCHYAYFNPGRWGSTAPDGPCWRPRGTGGGGTRLWSQQ
jgi:hypothetical protein